MAGNASRPAHRKLDREVYRLSGQFARQPFHEEGVIRSPNSAYPPAMHSILTIRPSPCAAWCSSYKARRFPYVTRHSPCATLSAPYVCILSFLFHCTHGCLLGIVLGSLHKYSARIGMPVQCRVLHTPCRRKLRYNVNAPQLARFYSLDLLRFYAWR